MISFSLKFLIILNLFPIVGQYSPKNWVSGTSSGSSGPAGHNSNPSDASTSTA